MADLIYDSFTKDLADNNIDLGADTFYLMLVSSAYTPSAAHAKRSDITGEVSGTGYTAGGAVVGTTTTTVDGTNHLTKFDGDDVTWANSTITARGAVLYKYRGGAASADELVKYFDFGADKSSTGAAFTVQFDANGILQVQA